MPNLRDISGQRRQLDIPISSWRPDHPALNNPGFPNCENLIPSDTGLYRPFPSTFTEGNNTLLDLVSGVTNVASILYGVRDPAANLPSYYCMAVDPVGDTLHFFRYDEAAETWADVTPVTPPNAEFGSFGVFDVFGTDIYVAYGGAGLIMSKPINDTTDFAVVTDAPEAQDIAIVRGFLVAINVTELGTTSATRVTWSGQGDPTNWVSPIANPITALSQLRGFTQLEGGGRLQRIIPGVGGADALIFGQTKIWRMTFVGPPSVWDFQVVEESEGTPFMASVVPNGNRVYFLGRRGWMVTNGVSAERIGAGKIDRAFSQPNILDQRFRFDPRTQGAFQGGIRGAVSGDPISDKLIVYAYKAESDALRENIVTDGGATIDTDAGAPIEALINSNFNDTVLVFNETTGEWGNAKFNLQAVGRVETNRNQTDIPQLAGINNAMQLVRFSDTGQQASFVETALSTGQVNNRITVRRVWPYVDSENCTISILAAENLNDAPVQSSPLVLEDDAGVPVNESGRFVGIRLDIPANDSVAAIIGLSAEFADQGLGAVG